MTGTNGRTGRAIAAGLALLLAVAGGARAGDGGERRPSRLRAMAASLLLPGLGQRATGHPSRARVYFAVEAALAIGFVTGEAQGRALKNGYIEYAERFGGVADAGGKPDWYYRNLGRFSTTDEYIDEIARTARAIYGDDLKQREAYVRRNSPAPDERWTWRSDADRQEFRSRRQAGRNAVRRANFFLGAALLNRVVSVVDAARLAGRPSVPRATLFVRPTEEGSGYLCVQWKLN